MVVVVVVTAQWSMEELSHRYRPHPRMAVFFAFFFPGLVCAPCSLRFASRIPSVDTIQGPEDTPKEKF